MAINVQEAVQRIRRAGLTNTRIVPMPGNNPLDGDHQIEVHEGNQWSTVLMGVKKNIAEAIISQAASKVILG